MISRKTLLLLFVSSLFYAFLTAQNHHHQPGLCVEQHLHEQKMKNDPIYKAAQDRLEASTYRSMLRKQQAHQLAKNNTNCNSGTGDNSNESIPIIPVVVHVLHSSDYPEPGSVRNNPNDEQIRRAIQHLNDAFRNRGAYSDDGRAAKDPRNPDRALMKSQDIRVEFRLAERNRLNRAVTGIMRYETDEYARLDINRDDQMKRWVAEQNNNAFPTTQYANVYLVSSICDGDPNTSRDCGVAGYAYLAGSHGRFFDGIVNEMQYFGSTTTNSKVHIHEFGHYFNLRHTFQGGCGGSDCLRSGDLVCDTPGDDENRGLSCGNAQNSCTEDVNAGFFSVDQGDMYENYMDYFTIRCQNTFTQGQKDRMRSALFGARSSLLSSKGAIPVGSTLAAINTIAAPKGIACDPSISPRVEIENKGDRSITSMKIQYELGDGSPRFYDWNGNIAARSKQTITLPNLSLNNIGRYDLFVQILAVNGADADVSVDGFCQSFQFAPALTELPYCQSVVEDVIPIEWAVENPDEGVGFQTTRIDGCETRERYAFVLETWGQFPDQTTQDEIYTQAIDLSQYDAAYLDFDVAYATTFPNFNTILDLSVSTDCGASYTSVYNKTGDRLATTRVQAQNSTDMNAAFEPVACNEWRKESVNLSAYAGQKINIRIQASTANLTNSNVYEWGNNLYLDNFCLNFERCSAPIPTTESEI
ncbi:MAG: M43 family zinc metalloprotease, partial [Bacteroidota bacterium]